MQSTFFAYKHRYNRYNPWMKTVVRRIGNSLGVLLPKSLLDTWGIRAGDHLQLSERGLRPPGKPGSAQELLDERKRQLALAVVRDFSPRQIRAQSLANLHRWKSQGTWIPAYGEWQQILENESDGALFAAMLGRDEESNRLRQSMPFVGLLSQEQVKAIYEETGS
jgi:antitoxin component of MazEF toxin-antitoxin module